MHFTSLAYVPEQIGLILQICFNVLLLQYTYRPHISEQTTQKQQTAYFISSAIATFVSATNMLLK